MLVLTRRVGDQIVINDEIQVTVVSISGSRELGNKERAC